MIRELTGTHEHAVTLVEGLEIHHRLTAVATLAVHVLEQVQRQRARAVEQQDIAFLQAVEIAGGEFFQDAVDPVAIALGKAPFPV